MKREKLLEKLRQALRTEENATAIYMEHLSALAGRIEIDKHLADRIHSVLDFLVKENQRHKSLVLDMIELIERTERDDW